MAKQTKQAANYSAVASQLQSSQLLDKYDFVNIQSGNVKITAADAAFATGASTNGGTDRTTSLKAGGVSFFSAPSTNSGTVSVKQGAGGATSYFATDDSNSSTTVTTGSKGGAGTIAVSTTGTSSNQSLATRLQNFSTTDWLILAGVLAAGFAIYTIVRK